MRQEIDERVLDFIVAINHSVNSKKELQELSISKNLNAFTIAINKVGGYYDLV